MNALLRALTDSRGIENIEQALGMPDITSDAMRRAIDGWFDAWFSRVPPDEEDPCQRIPYAVVNKLGKAVFAEYDSSLQNTGTPKLQYLDRARQAFDAKKRELLQWCMVGGETWAKPVFAPDGLTWQVIRRRRGADLGPRAGRARDRPGLLRKKRGGRPPILHAGGAAHDGAGRAAYDRKPAVPG